MQCKLYGLGCRYIVTDCFWNNVSIENGNTVHGAEDSEKAECNVWHFTVLPLTLTQELLSHVVGV